MVFLQGILPIVQIVLSALLIVAVVLQRTGASLGGAFGADNFSSGFHTRRGLEKVLFRATIVLSILFAVSALISLLISYRAAPAQGSALGYALLSAMNTP